MAKEKIPQTPAEFQRATRINRFGGWGLCIAGSCTGLGAMVDAYRIVNEAPLSETGNSAIKAIVFVGIMGLMNRVTGRGHDYRGYADVLEQRGQQLAAAMAAETPGLLTAYLEAGNTSNVNKHDNGEAEVAVLSVPTESPYGPPPVWRPSDQR